MSDRRLRDEKTLYTMHLMYCRAKHGKSPDDSGLCEDCRHLLDYSLARTRNCRWKKDGRLCSSCQVHCFEEPERQQIRMVMRYSGPRLIFRAPVLALRYIYLKTRQRSIS